MKTKKLAKRTLFKGGTILDPVKEKEFMGDILIVNGKIAAVGKVNVDDADVIDCKGWVVTHGFCDLHVHFREPGREDKETLETGSRAALAGGFTRVCAMPNTNPPIDSPESVRFVAEKSRNCPIHIHPIGAATKGQKGEELTEMAGMADEGAVAFSDDGRPIMNGGVMRRILEYAGMLGKPVINHAEDDGLRNEGLMNEGLMSTRLGLPGNPTQAEAIMVHRDLEIAKLTGAKLHIPHISTASATHHVAEMKQRYDQVTAEVTPHHLYFTDDDLGEYDTNLKVAPPIRGNADRKALINGLKNGTIDCIATDHAPHTIEDKESTFDLAAFGMIGLESCLGAVLKILVQEEGVNLLTVVKALTVNPRKIMGFETNLLTEKTVAELTIFNPHENWDFSRENIYSKSINSPYLGKSLAGKVKYTIVKGHLYSY
ncbi:MAG TPA: dihydroorotase [Candidatus Marinimicrobia bacterium]|nr:dihydroorotase [Candidatus Neomarinimicrobiota bacterium]